MISALKARGIPVAGADRLVLTEQIAVQDLMALGDFLMLPEDDLALAACSSRRCSASTTTTCWRSRPGRKGIAVAGAGRRAPANDARFATRRPRP